MYQLKFIKQFFGALTFLLLSINLRAQDSSLIKINYGFSYDYHDFIPVKSFSNSWVKPGFCYTNSFGIGLNYYLFKKKKIGVSVQLSVSDKAMNLRSEYNQIIDPYYRNPKYKTQKNFNFNYDYLIYGCTFKVSYIIKKRVEPFIGFGRYFATLNSQNFKEDSMVIAINHGYNSAYMKTYILPQKITLNMYMIGTNFILSKKFQVGLFVSHYRQKSLSENINALRKEGVTKDAIFFYNYLSIGLSTLIKLF